MSNIPLCPFCNEKAIARYGETTTLIGFSTFTDDDGKLHHHDDNCLNQTFSCSNYHSWKLSRRRRCKTKGCDWRGKENCFCHNGKKIDDFCADDVPLVFNHAKSC
ncbi:hypothetical protein LCGC14_1525170 [marine sediment metagenome]|uniref:Uncharacterized protein n=1 Tax=marine sediment metagenome TaxID=412755 RepID=A0A0F9JIA9_9ZZZZ